ncbi:MAG: CCA tRNA nucleotidyltransferase [Pseudomonadota bacterium]
MNGVRVSPDWLQDAALAAVFDALEAAGGAVRVNGGAVRNTLLEEPVADIDLSTTLHPPQAMEALRSAGLKAVPTGIDHGTVTAVSDHRGFEVTTLREDVETDGRRAVVKFATEWDKDALRRDLTMNALYLDRDGIVHDPLGGYEDVLARRVRFIGDAEQRIREDYLRILRFFRFFAWYGHGRPDAEGLKACARLKDDMDALSAERVWAELVKMFAASDPSRALLWMRTTGVLTKVLPESEKWGIDAIPRLMQTEAELGWQPDALVRLMAIIPPRPDVVEGLSKRLKVANTVRDRLAGWTQAPVPTPDWTDAELRAQLYLNRKAGDAMADRLRLAIPAATSGSDDRTRLLTMLDMAERYEAPALPISGKDLIDQGHTPGVGLGETLAAAEADWIGSDFTLTRADLLARASDD